MNSTKEQCFVHLATYRLADLRTTGANLGPDVFKNEITAALADIVSTRLANICEEHGWNLIDIHVLPDRIEALLTGMEPDGETGRSVAEVLDAAVYLGISPCAAAVLN